MSQGLAADRRGSPEGSPINSVPGQMQNTDAFLVSVEGATPAEGHQALATQTQALSRLLHQALAPPHEVSADEPIVRDRSWQQNIKVRRGNKIGVDVDVSWSGEGDAQINAQSASKLGSALMMALGLPATAIGAYLGYNHISPLGFLPGMKLAAGLGGVLFLIVALVIANVLSSSLTRGQAPANQQLLTQVRATVARLPGVRSA
jgi:hypothetical protein